MKKIALAIIAAAIIIAHSLDVKPADAGDVIDAIISLWILLYVVFGDDTQKIQTLPAPCQDSPK